ncbi:tRNA (N(6)-L-threonylcarbamoyladenosine(37)-C(2))-methylthiotransferase MtaB [bacterium]|nr:tRNA (N(6)-L-threonylcarbamoyladenosine(37)-C(2))-methylthiotransferase MtaB [bacterium]
MSGQTENPATPTRTPTGTQKVFIKTLGCKVNTFDGHAIGNQFRAKGYTVVDSPEQADVTVLNTCSVTSAADREARYLIRRYRRENPDTRMVVTGCYAQTDSARLAAMKEVDFVVPNEAKDRLLDFIGAETGQADTGRKVPDGVKTVSENRQSHFKSSLVLFDDASSSQTRAFVKIQDGCNGFCAYCLIPYARGASRSVQAEQAFNEIKRLIDAGTPEVVLTGIHIGDYGRDLDSFAGDAEPFASFVESIMQIPGLGRLRISSLEPGELTRELLEVLKRHEDKFCQHFHLPLQSGHDRLLKAMRRTYDTAGYEAAVTAAREHFPDASFGADVIPGFPGETEEEFASTMDFIERVGLSYLHVFPYSLRPNTAAARMPGHLPQEIVKERAARLRALSDKLAARYAARFTGKQVDVLWEKDVDAAGRRSGLTRNYLQVVSASGTGGPGGLEAGMSGIYRVKGFTDSGKLLVLNCST